MSSSFRNGIWRWVTVLAFALSVIPLAVSSQGSPVSEEVVQEPPTVEPVIEAPPPTVEPVVEPPSFTPEPPAVVPTDPPETPAVEPSAIPPTETPFAIVTEIRTETPTPSPSPSPTETPTPTSTSTPVALSIQIESRELTFGQIDATGTVSETSPAGLFSQPMQEGAYFVLPAAVTIEVTGDFDWEIACGASGQNTMSLDMIERGRLEWRLAGEAVWTRFASTHNESICLAGSPHNPKTIVLDLRLLVSRSDESGWFAVKLDFNLLARA